MMAIRTTRIRIIPKRKKKIRFYLQKEEKENKKLTLILEFGVISLSPPPWEKLSMSMTKLSDVSAL